MPKNKPATTDPEPEKEGLLKATAAAIGSAAGAVAAVASAVQHHGSPPAPKPSGKLMKKHKSRLPRRQKKALAKKNAVQAESAS